MTIIQRTLSKDMDTKSLELEALDEIKSKVTRYGYEYTLMNFDKDGGDFYIIERGKGNTLKYLRCQSKGRSIYPNRSNVVIPKSYVCDNFLVFVYVKPENLDDVETYLYTAEDIESVWNESEESYSLYLSKSFINDKSHNKYLFKKDRATVIGTLLTMVGRNQDVDSVNAMSEMEFYFNMWQKTGGLPSIEYLREIYNNDEVLATIGPTKFVFLICALIIQNQDDDTSLSVDWAYTLLKDLRCEVDGLDKCSEGRSYLTHAAMSYYKTWVIELVSSEGTLVGYHLHIGDDEEFLDAYVRR